MKLYSLYDRKSNSYGTVFTSENNQTAQRYFQYLCSLPVNEIIRDDVELYSLGEFDMKTGFITGVTKDFVCNFVYEESFTNMIRQQARNEFYQDLLDKEREFDDRMEVNTDEE